MKCLFQQRNEKTALPVGETWPVRGKRIAMSDTNPNIPHETSVIDRPEDDGEPQVLIRLLLVSYYYSGVAELTVTHDTLTIVDWEGTHVFKRYDAPRCVHVKWLTLQVMLPSGKKRSYRICKNNPDLFLNLAHLEVWLDARLMDNHVKSQQRVMERQKIWLGFRCFEGLRRVIQVGAWISFVLILCVILFIVAIETFPRPDIDATEDDHPVLLAIPIVWFSTIWFFSGISALAMRSRAIEGAVFAAIFHLILLPVAVVSLNIIGAIWALIVVVSCIFCGGRYMSLR